MDTRITASDPSALLRELRALAADARAAAGPDALSGPFGATPPGRTPAGEEPDGFASVLAQALDQVNAIQSNAAALAESFERGEAGVSLAEVMVASQKAGIAFQAVVEVRNRLVRAYQDVMNMPM